jgi:hypothetical protein
MCINACERDVPISISDDIINWSTHYRQETFPTTKCIQNHAMTRKLNNSFFFFANQLQGGGGKSWVKAVQTEWKILMNDLPGTYSTSRSWHLKSA